MKTKVSPAQRIKLYKRLAKYLRSKNEVELADYFWYLACFTKCYMRDK